ncbi:MAG: 16S rRNA (adenine(1518)-N(6)/adenine(1519)-N(6))-dimethyltransferase RsmA [Oscillospiraceae bacterium]|nr:16S rRNA (adenine(1518)-N(6)/adenine(1519)-N(6))-dimethyltransferase RsmA [Oscillospiraceae bacterium]
MNLTDIREINRLLQGAGFRFSKSMGQNFLCDASVPPRIADAAGLDAETGVLEIGPGVGCLTVELSRRAGHVISVELDGKLQSVLAQTLRGCENVEVRFADVLKLDLRALAAESFADCKSVVVCANLPYNITSPALTALVNADRFARITVMVQREVARRICARENTADYGAFTVLMQWHTVPELLFDVPPGSFIPAPKVTSSVIRLTRRPAPPVQVADEKRMFALVRAAFNQRRKTLCNAMMHGLGLTREQADAALAACGLDARIRGEALSIPQFAALSDRIELR